MTRTLSFLVLLCGLTGAPAGSMEQAASPQGVSVGVPHATARAPAMTAISRDNGRSNRAHDTHHRLPAIPTVAPLVSPPGAAGSRHRGCADREFIETRRRLTYRAHAPPACT